MTDLKNEYKNQLLKIIQIQAEVIEQYDLFDQQTKDSFLYYGERLVYRLGNESFTVTQIKSLTDGMLTYWRNSIGVATELFWTDIRKNNIIVERKDELIFALEKGRFRNVGIGMEARKEWKIIKYFASIKNRFTSDEIEIIDYIIDQDQTKRLEILKKCLKKKEIPQTQYLKFGECMAYMNNCGLWNKYFTKEEVEELDTIWGNFRSK